MKNIIPKATLQRYPIYLKALRKIKSLKIKKILSHELSDYVTIKPTTIRRDFSLIGSLGKQGYGYDVDKLIEIFSAELGVTFDEKIILVGAGNLGKALLNYNHWDNVVGEIVCAFDLQPSKVGKISIPCYDIKDLKKYMPKGTRIAILTVTNDIQKTVDKLVSCGITGIVDFTNEHYIIPKNVIVRNIDVVSTIQELVLATNKVKEKENV